MIDKSKTTRVLGLLTVLAFASAACASSTLIRSYPEGAKVYMGGEYMGKTPYLHTDTAIVGTVHHVRLEHPGCEEFTAVFTRSEEFDVGACIGGVLVMVPFLWIMGYKPERTFELRCGGRRGSASDAIVR